MITVMQSVLRLFVFDLWNSLSIMTIDLWTIVVEYPATIFSYAVKSYFPEWYLGFTDEIWTVPDNDNVVNCTSTRPVKKCVNSVFIVNEVIAETLYNHKMDSNKACYYLSYTLTLWWAT